MAITSYPPKQTIKPNLVFGGASPQSGYVSNQHEDNNFIKKNALNAVKFNEYERVLHLISTKIGNASDGIFGTVGDGSIGDVIRNLDTRVTDLQSDSGSGSSGGSPFYFWLMGGNTFLDPHYTKGDHPSDQKAEGFYLDITEEVGTDHEFEIARGVGIVGEEKQNIKFSETNADIVRPIRRVEFEVVANLLETNNGDGNEVGEQYNVDSSTDYIYLNHKFIKSEYFTNIDSPNVISSFLKIDNQPSKYIEGTGGNTYTLDKETGKLTFSAGLKSLFGAGVDIDIFYAWYKYRKDIIYLDNTNPDEPTVNVRRGESKDTLEDVFDNVLYKINDNNGILTPDNEPPNIFEPIDEINLRKLYEYVSYPWNALDEKSVIGSYHQSINKLDNIIDLRTDPSQSIQKWKSINNGVLENSTFFIYADKKVNGANDLLKVNVGSIDTLIDGRVVKTQETSIVLDTGTPSVNHRIVALCSDYTGKVIASATSSSTTNSYPAIPNIPLDQEEDRDNNGNPDVVKYDYDSYIAYILIPANATSYSECYTIVNDVQREKTYSTSDPIEAILISALYDSGFYTDINFDDSILETINVGILEKEIKGEFDNEVSEVSFVNYARLLAASKTLPANIHTIINTTTKVISSIGTTYVIPNTIRNIQSHASLTVNDPIDFDYTNITFTTGSLVCNSNDISFESCKLNFANTSGFTSEGLSIVKCTGFINSITQTNSSDITLQQCELKIDSISGENNITSIGVNKLDIESLTTSTGSFITSNDSTYDIATMNKAIVSSACEMKIGTLNTLPISNTFDNNIVISIDSFNMAYDIFVYDVRFGTSSSSSCNVKIKDGLTRGRIIIGDSANVEISGEFNIYTSYPFAPPTETIQKGEPIIFDSGYNTTTLKTTGNGVIKSPGVSNRLIHLQTNSSDINIDCKIDVGTVNLQIAYFNGNNIYDCSIKLNVTGGSSPTYCFLGLNTGSYTGLNLDLNTDLTPGILATYIDNSDIKFKGKKPSTHVFDDCNNLTFTGHWWPSVITTWEVIDAHGSFVTTDTF
jgi:hypothetical protein